MSSLNSTEIKTLNNWARTEPSLRSVFPYTEGRPGLGDRLNSLGSGGGSPLTVTDNEHIFNNVSEIEFNRSEFYLTEDPSGNPIVNSIVSSSSSSGPDDDSAFLRRDGTVSMTGDLNMGGNDVLNAHAGTFSDRIVAEAFYLIGNGNGLSDGQMYVKGGVSTIETNGLLVRSIEPNSNISNNISITTPGNLTVDADIMNFTTSSGGSILFDASLGGGVAFNAVEIDLIASDSIVVDGAIISSDSIWSDSTITGEAFYLVTGGELKSLTVKETDGNPPAFRNVGRISFDSSSFYLGNDSTGQPVVSFRGTASGGTSGIDINIDAKTVHTTLLSFNAADFYINTTSGGNPQVSLIRNTAPLFVRNVSVQTKGDVTSNDATFVGVPELAFSVQSGNTYHFRFLCLMNATASTSEGFTIQLSIPSVTDFNAKVELVNATGTTGQTIFWLSPSVTTATTLNSLIAFKTPNIIEGTITPSANGTVQFSFHTENFVPGTTCSNNSFVEWERIR